MNMIAVHKQRWWRLGLAIAASVVTAACGGGSDSSGVTSGRATGTLRAALTDAPACGFDQINVTVERVRVHTSVDAGPTASGWQDVVVTPARKVNLLDLTNGVLQELGQTALPAGQYTQLRLVLLPNAGGTPANSVVPTGGSELPLDTPSAVQNGIKLIHPFTVPEGGLADVVLDFDACKSIVRRGNGTYGLKPVVAVSPRIVAEIVGNVDPALTGTTVSAQVGGNVVRATTPDATGAFTLAYLDPATSPTVAVVITASGRATAVVTGVPIAVQSTTRISTAAMPIALPASATRIASGTVTPAAGASVRAVQAVGTVPAIEVGAVNADASGAYGLTLPTAAPLLASYATPLPLVFSPQAADAAKYTLEASADGRLPQSASVDLSAANANVIFNLPPAP